MPISHNLLLEQKNRIKAFN